MTRATPSRRVPAVVLLGAGLVAALAGCSSAGSGVTTGPGIDVVAQVQSQLATTGVQADPGSLTCAGDLAPQAGKTVACGFTSEGQPVDLVAEVASVDGARATIQISTRARAVPRALLADGVGDRVGGEIGRTPSTACDGDLQPTVGSSTTCTLTDGDAKRAVRVAVTSVEGGRVAYSIAGA